MQEDLFTVKFEPLTPDEIELNSRAVEMAQRFNSAERDVIKILIEVESSRFYLKLNCASLRAYCREVLKLSDSVAGYHVSIVYKSREVPALAEAVQEGRLSVATAAQVVSVATKENCETWFDKAETLTKRELEQEVAKASPHPRKKTRVRAVAEDRHSFQFEGSDKLRAVIERLMEVESQRLGRSVSIEEVLLASGETHLDKFDPVRKAARSKRQSEAKPTYKNGKRTAIPAAVQHEVNRRDKGCCQARGSNGAKCGSQRYVDLHHIVEVSKGGQHEAENIVTLCGYHHRMMHRASVGEEIRV